MAGILVRYCRVVLIYLFARSHIPAFITSFLKVLDSIQCPMNLYLSIILISIRIAVIDNLIYLQSTLLIHQIFTAGKSLIYHKSTPLICQIVTVGENLVYIPTSIVLCRYIKFSSTVALIDISMIELAHTLRNQLRLLLVS